jgi:hypothetical protein
LNRVISHAKLEHQPSQITYSKHTDTSPYNIVCLNFYFFESNLKSRPSSAKVQQSFLNSPVNLRDFGQYLSKISVELVRMCMCILKVMKPYSNSCIKFTLWSRHIAIRYNGLITFRNPGPTSQSNDLLI